MRNCFYIALRWAIAVVLTGETGQGAFAQDGQQDSFFVDESGVATLTNRPEYYRADDRFMEIGLDYQPIVIKRAYQFTKTGRIETDDDYQALIEHYADKYNLNASLVQAVIKAESNFDPYAVSKAGAQGLMQLMPGTAAEMSIKDVFDPGQNIAGGTQYLFKLLKLFGNDLDLALAAYNAGPGTVKKYGGIPPYKETQSYVTKVKRYMDDFSKGDAQVHINRNTKRRNQRFRPSAQLPYVVHFKSGASQPALRVKEAKNLYVLEYNLRQYTVKKSLVDRIEKL